MLLTTDNICKAMTGKPLARLDGKALTDTVTLILRDTMVYAGYEATLIVENAGELAKDLKASYPKLTLDELRLVCKAGLTGELGEVKRPSCAAVLRWVEAYVKSAQLADARKIRPKAEAPKLTKEQGEALYRKEIPGSLERRIEDVRTIGRFGPNAIPHVSAQIFDWLRHDGDLAITTDQWNAAVEKAKKETASGNIFKMEHVEGGERLIRSKAKHIALQEWIFNELAAGRRIRVPDKITSIYN